MSVNSSSISKEVFQCHVSTVTIFIMNGVTGLKLLLLLPLSSYILYLAQQRWQQRRSFKTVSHSDLFTYHLAFMELIGITGALLFLGGVNTHNSTVTVAGMSINYITYYGELFFSLLTCVERYLAVVHPITCRGLKDARGIRIRNVTIGCIWLLSFGMTTKEAGHLKAEPLDFFFAAASVSVISFCSVSVLCVLFRPGPKQGGQQKDGVDQSRLRAFYTITVISIVVWLWFVVLLIDAALLHSTVLDDAVRCLIVVGIGWLNLPLFTQIQETVLLQSPIAASDNNTRVSTKSENILKKLVVQECGNV